MKRQKTGLLRNKTHNRVARTYKIPQVTTRFKQYQSSQYRYILQDRTDNGRLKSSEDQTVIGRLKSSQDQTLIGRLKSSEYQAVIGRLSDS